MSNQIKKYENWQKMGNLRHYKTPFLRLYNKLVRNAKRKNIKCSLVYEEFLQFTKKKICTYCHSKIEWIAHGKKAIKYNLDRKDNNIGYSFKNCVVCCKTCNEAKGNRYNFKTWYKMTSFLREK